jgi:DNA-binding NarL/FixJ family response regulator
MTTPHATTGRLPGHAMIHTYHTLMAALADAQATTYQAVIDMAAKGYSRAAIARATGLSRRTIMKIMRLP